MQQAVGQAELLERDDELAVVGEALDRACAGDGGVVTVEAPAGLGKTALLAAAQERAADRGMLVLSARGFELERRFTFGILRQLYEPYLASVGADERDRLLAGSAAPAGPAVGVAAPAGGESFDPMFAISHGAYWLTANLADDRPLLIAIDDAQWADTASLRCAIYVAGRLRDLPVSMLVAARPGEPDAPDDLLAGLFATAGTRLLAPGPLSVAATGRLIGERAGTDPDPSFAAAAHELTGGNPFFVAALAGELHEHGIEPDDAGARRLPAITPDAVGRAVLVRLMRLGDGAVALAQAVAVLGDGASLAHAADLAGLELPEAAPAADRLAHADILRPGVNSVGVNWVGVNWVGVNWVGVNSLAFSHPLVREAVREETPAHSRALLHRRAAGLLDDAGASIEQVASQLLLSPPAGDAWVAERLLRAGEAAESCGDVDSAVAFLKRALEEPPPAATRASVLHVLGRSELRGGGAEGFAHMDEAAQVAEEPAIKAAIGFDQARVMLLAGRPEAVDALEQASAWLPRDERGDAVRKEIDLIALGRTMPATAPLVRQRADALVDVASRRDPGWESALAVTAGQAYLRNNPASAIVELARSSLESRRARGDDPAESPSFIGACNLLSLSGDYEQAEAHLGHVIEHARRANAWIGFTSAASWRGASALRRGDLAQAEADSRMALDAAGPTFTSPTLPTIVGVLVEVMIERGDLDDADRLLVAHDYTGDLLPFQSFNDLLFARGRLRLAQGRADDALADITAAGQATLALGFGGPGPFPWRPWAALVLAGLGRDGAAREMAAEGLALARAFGAPRDLGVALRACGLVGGGDAGIDQLSESVDVLAGSPVALELARSQTDLGAALRRAGRRKDARAVLSEGLDGASRCGATALAERARAELVTAGAKPRRERISGPAALTASERRVADLAIDGLTNRQIAEALFVTASTVEKHLAGVYSKLGIAGRGDLRAAFER